MNKSQIQSIVDEIENYVEGNGHYKICIGDSEWDDVPLDKLEKEIYKRGFNISVNGDVWTIRI